MRISTSINYPIIEDNETIVYEPQLELFPLPEEHIDKDYSSALDKKKKLGQVFTPTDLARFMVSLIKESVRDSNQILDPCIGPNTFLSQFDDIQYNLQLTGMEVDLGLMTSPILEFYKKPNRHLLLESFLQHPISKKYDFIIQNPPYVRQELLNRGINSKELALENISSKIASLIPSQSNLYVYFLVKGILHLKENGTMVAVIYDSWLYSSFGVSLKKIFNSLGFIERIYHLKNNAFSNADVGATVIYFKKRKIEKLNNYFIKYYSVDFITELHGPKKSNKLVPLNIRLSDFEKFNFNQSCSIDFTSTFFTKLKSLSNQIVQRGTSSIANGYFLHDTLRFKESIPIIKDVSKIETFCASAATSYLLYISGKPSKETQNYLNTVRTSILEAGDKYKAVRNKILRSENWHKITLKKPGNFIFNYYLRNNIDFLLNENRLDVSDNFYIMNIAENPFAHLAILNSSFSKISVLSKSRNQGNGLRKVQLYEFNDVSVININALSLEVIKKLEKLGKEMKNVERYTKSKNAISRSIDSILLSEYNKTVLNKITLTDLETELKKYFN